MEEITGNLESCDIILRRYRNYLDGIIFSENSYFTHVGICYREDENKPWEVLHCTGELGVHRSSLEKFCNCDNIAVLRFSLDRTVEENKIANYIIKEERNAANNVNLKQEELDLYNYLMTNTKTKVQHNIFNNSKSFSEHYSTIVTDRALSLMGAEYDFDFDFRNFQTFSCIEYVWYCFKCLFPLHRIRVKDFEFFQWIIMPIIIPDVFIKNDFFKYIYTSLPEARSKKLLKKYVKKGRWEFWGFLISLFAWNIIILIVWFRLQYKG